MRRDDTDRMKAVSPPLDRLALNLGSEKTATYAEPGCPYQRGTNENTNGLIRQYFPEGADFRDISHHEIPHEVLFEKDWPLLAIE